MSKRASHWKRKRQFWQRERPRQRLALIVQEMVAHGARYYQIHISGPQGVSLKGSNDQQTWVPLRVQSFTYRYERSLLRESDGCSMPEPFNYPDIHLTINDREYQLPFNTVFFNIDDRIELIPLIFSPLDDHCSPLDASDSTIALPGTDSDYSSPEAWEQGVHEMIEQVRQRHSE